MSDDSRVSRPDLSVLRMDPEELEGRRGAGWVVWLLAVIGLVAGGYCALLYFEPPFLLPRVETSSVRRETPVQQSTVLTATGYTYARQRAAVGAKIIGRILELPVEEGDRLAIGDLIAVLDSADLEAAVAQAEASLLEVRARLADAEREAARQARLFEAEVTSRAELDAAETAVAVVRAQVELAEARLASAEAQLAYTHIYAPIDGVVIEKNVEVGEMVAPGGFTSQQSTGAILRMADPASLEVEADVNESYIARLSPGMPVTIDVDAVPDRPYRGRLRQIVPTADRQRAVVEVKVTIDDRDRHLVPDMSCTVTFLDEGATPEALESEPVIYIPTAAVRGSATAPWALVVEDGVLERRELALGEVEGSEQVVIDGVAAGDRVVVGELGDLEPGDKVRLAERS
ncbi:MAG: efflux RND transporter periplasmic adaptor subunit [Holophagales bacterium]|nr:efflux RND transporter periplasmic adaptor subunit [Holophagales bacterium]